MKLPEADMRNIDVGMAKPRESRYEKRKANRSWWDELILTIREGRPSSQSRKDYEAYVKAQDDVRDQQDQIRARKAEEKRQADNAELSMGRYNSWMSRPGMEKPSPGAKAIRKDVEDMFDKARTESARKKFVIEHGRDPVSPGEFNDWRNRYGI